MIDLLNRSAASYRLRRRRFLSGLGTCAGGALSLGMSRSGWLPLLAAQGIRGGDIRDDHPAKAKRVVLLWLNGGPATIDLWDLKTRHDNGGPIREIMTCTPGVRFSEHLPQLAGWSEQLAIVRSMSTREGDHSRATHLTRRGYVPQAGIDFPDLGALVAEQLFYPDQLLPGFISIAPPSESFSSNGFLAPCSAPMQVGRRARSPSDLVVRDLVTDEHAIARATEPRRLLEHFNEQFQSNHPDPVAQRYAVATERAFAAMSDRAAGVFDLESEPPATRDRYGQNVFGQGCLLARRLLENDVCFVEVVLDGWDTHSDNFNRVAELSQRLDRAFAALLQDLSDRGLLESTIVVCMGEFGRTPKINANTGRDHYPAAWSAVVAGGGIGRGQVIGKTSEDGMQVESSPHSIPDLIATLCNALGIDPSKQNDSNVGRPIRIADPSAEIIRGLA